METCESHQGLVKQLASRQGLAGIVMRDASLFLAYHSSTTSGVRAGRALTARSARALENHMIDMGQRTKRGC